MSSIIGIDLGTTNSLIAAWHNGESRLITNAAGSYLTPSAVSFDNDHVLIGEAAANRVITHPAETFSYFKRDMGTPKRFGNGRKALRAEDLSALVIRQLLDDAELVLGTRPSEAVISVPAYFSDAQRHATRAAGQIAGLTVERLINEPTAAAMAHGLHENADGRTIVVIDLGGGTLDVSVVECFDGVMEVHASAGDNNLGGRDFDELLRAWFVKTHSIDYIGLELSARNRLVRACQQARHDLSSSHNTELTITAGKGRRQKTYTSALDRAHFEKLAAPLLNRLQIVVERAIRDCRLSLQAIDDIVLVGGATRMPVVRNLIGRMFRRLPAANVDPDQIVARGAAIQAALKARDSSLEDVVLTDVSPYTLGIGIARETDRDQWSEGFYLPIIERNSRVPVSRMDTVHPISELQKTVTVPIFQGESRLVKNNIRLGEIEVPVGKGDDRSVQVRFTYDINGILEVDVEVPGTGEHRNLVINSSGKMLSEEDIRKSLQSISHLKVLPRETIQNVTTLSRAERMYEEALGEERSYIGELIARFERILDGQDPEQIDAARAELAQLLDDLDQGRFR